MGLTMDGSLIVTGVMEQTVAFLVEVAMHALINKDTALDSKLILQSHRGIVLT